MPNKKALESHPRPILPVTCILAVLLTPVPVPVFLHSSCTCVFFSSTFTSSSSRVSPVTLSHALRVPGSNMPLLLPVHLPALHRNTAQVLGLYVLTPRLSSTHSSRTSGPTTPQKPPVTFVTLNPMRSSLLSFDSAQDTILPSPLRHFYISVAGSCCAHLPSG